jgi:hypothetical protein
VPEKRPLQTSYDRLATSSEIPTDSDEESALPPSDEKDSSAEEQGQPILLPRLASRGEHSATRKICLLSTAIITAVLLILTLVFSASTLQPRSAAQTSLFKPSPLGLNCGNSLASARANNCTFDLLSYSWTPSACYERETDAEFRAWTSSPTRRFGAFPFFIDRNATIRISDVEAMSFRAGSLAHTTQEEHLGHCIFWMRRIERILEGNGRFTGRGMMDSAVPHSLHCTESLLKRLEEGIDPVDRNELHAVIGIGFNSC